MRKKIDLMDNTMNLIFKMSEGNPGALTVLMEILQRPNALIAILGLDDMNIRGWQIWVAYKNHCKNNVDLLLELIKKRDSKMVDTINRAAVKANVPTRSTIGGASFNR